MKLKIIQTSDIHGYFNEDEEYKYGNFGLLKLSSQFNKDDNTILIDTGDLIQGNDFANYLAFEKKEECNIYSKILNKLQYDCIALGNHEFNFGLDYLNECYKEFNGEILNANIDGLNFTKPYTIINKGNYKIGIIGLTTSSIPMFENQNNITGLTFNDTVKTYAKYEEELKSKCDYIIVNYHGGCELDVDDLTTPTEVITNENEGVRLFNEFKSIDVILTGHQHRTFIKNHNNRIVTQPSRSAEGFVYLEIDLETKQLIDSRYVENKGIVNENCSMLDNLTEDFNNYLNEVFGVCDKDMLISDHLKARANGHELTKFLSDVQLNASGAEITCTSLFDTAVGFTKEITRKQLLNNFPFPNTLRVFKMHRDDILKAVEVSASYFDIKDGKLVESDKFTIPKREAYQYDLFYGFNYTIDITKEVGNRVVKHSLEDRYYSFCVSNYRASNFAWYPMFENQELIKDIDINISDLIIEYLKKHKNLKLTKESNFKIIY